jgi:hypothetical protein
MPDQSKPRKPRLARDLRVGDIVGPARIVALKPVMAVCSPRKGAAPVSAVKITWHTGVSTTLADDVKVAA